MTTLSAPPSLLEPMAAYDRLPASALLLWMSHPAWYSTVWPIYDYDLAVNGAYYGARRSCEPRHVHADGTSGRSTTLRHR